MKISHDVNGVEIMLLRHPMGEEGKLAQFPSVFFLKHIFENFCATKDCEGTKVRYREQGNVFPREKIQKGGKLE